MFPYQFLQCSVDYSSYLLNPDNWFGMAFDPRSRIGKAPITGKRWWQSRNQVSISEVFPVLSFFFPKFDWFLWFSYIFRILFDIWLLKDFIPFSFYIIHLHAWLVPFQCEYWIRARTYDADHEILFRTFRSWCHFYLFNFFQCWWIPAQINQTAGQLSVGSARAEGNILVFSKIKAKSDLLIYRRQF